MANQELETLTYCLAHDLRAPVRQTHGYAQILQDDFLSQMPINAQLYLNKIEERGRSMGLMVDDLLNLFGIARKDFYRQVTNLNDIVQDIVAAAKSDNPTPDIQWKIGEISSCDCNPGLIKQAFANLISNSIKYTKFVTNATIEIGQTVIGNEEVIFIKDNGVGFDMTYIDSYLGCFNVCMGRRNLKVAVSVWRLFPELCANMVAVSGPKEWSIREPLSILHSAPGRRQ